MITQLLQFLDRIGVYLICACIPGILFILNGIHIIKTKQTISVGRDSHFHWKRPVLLKGKQATRDGIWGIIFGAVIFLMGLVMIIGVLQ
jgi:hypothetical protein